MNELINNIIKALPIYTLYRNRKQRYIYAAKFNISYEEAKKCSVISSHNQEKILRRAKIHDVGTGEFFYSLDTSIIIDKRKRVIDNMPVDYGYVLHNCIGHDLPIVCDYVKKINDSRINLKEPESLKEALQAILFYNSLLWQTGHSLVGLGRLDKVLAQYRIDEEAETLICDFLTTLHAEYSFKSSALRGDTGQIIILGGLNEDGSYFCNEYTYLFIKCLQKIKLPDPKILLRCSVKMPYDLLELAVECVSTGIGSPLFSNDDIVINKLIDFGYEQKDAYNYGVSACWEPLSIGNSLEQNNLTNIEYGRYINEIITDPKFITCNTFDEVLYLYFEKLKDKCHEICKYLDGMEWERDPLLTFLMGLDKDISAGGAKYNNYGILSVGMSAAVNSLLNIKTLVFQNRRYSLSDVQDIILRNYAESIPDLSVNDNGFGIDCDASIGLTNRIIKTTEEYLAFYRNKFGGKVKFGLSSPSYIDSSRNVGATLDGRKAGEPFQTHISRDKGNAITEIMNFESKLDFTGISCNANVIDVMIQSTLIKDNIAKFASYIMGGLREGIFQLQMNVLSYVQLIDAKEHPEKYPDLIVRVWGFSAYFNDLPEEYKDNLIRRAREMEQVK